MFYAAERKTFYSVWLISSMSAKKAEKYRKKAHKISLILFLSLISQILSGNDKKIIIIQLKHLKDISARKQKYLTEIILYIHATG